MFWTISDAHLCLLAQDQAYSKGKLRFCIDILYKHVMSSRALLPYREKTEVYLLTTDGKRVLAQDHGKYVMFPGGGVDTGDRKNLAAAARRELKEEVGATVAPGTLRHLITVDWDWFPEWANTPTRKERYAQFRGERVHFFVGQVGAVRVSISSQTDVWPGASEAAKSLPLTKCVQLVTRYGTRDHPNTRPYRIAQQLTLEVLRAQGRK
jgi:8-oxo-dGTP pyrophosphatase MutT (NUDIX family)